MQLNVLAIDDEPLALRVLAAHAKKVPFLNLVATTTNPVEGLLRVQQGGVDLVLLDVQMPTLTGIQFLQLLTNQCPVILTTAYTQYALEGYDYAVVDYLLKPISFERFLKAVQRVYTARIAPVPVADSPAPAIDYLFVKTENRLLKINMGDICYIEGGREYATIVTTDTRVLTLTSLAKLLDSLPPPGFCRVHKSYIVALNKIDMVERQRIYIANTVLPIGETYRLDFSRLLGDTG